MPEMPPGSVPGKGRTFMEVGPGAFTILFCIFYFLGFGYLLVLGIASLIEYPTETFDAIMIGVALAFLLPVIFILPNTTGIYENGIRLSRPLILRLIGKHSFFKWEDILAVYPAVFTSSAQLATPQPGWYHPVGAYWTKYGQGAAAFGQVFGKLLTDRGTRNGLAIETAEGQFILTLGSQGDGRSPYYQMMPFVQYSMGVRNIPLIRKPLKLTDEELAAVFEESGDIPIKWYVTAATLALGLPFLLMFIMAGIILLVSPVPADWNVPLIISVVIISTTLFVTIYQYKTVKGNNAKNKLYYYYASLPPEPTAQPQVPSFQPPAGSEPGEKIWDPSQE